MKFKNKIMAVLVLMAGLGLGCFTPVKAQVINNISDKGKILVDKTAVKDDDIYGRGATVTLKATGNSYDEVKTLDIVLVIDRSQSMLNNGKLTSAKNSATNLVNKLLEDNTYNNVKVGIVTFGDKVIDNLTSTSLSNDKVVLLGIISHLTDPFNNSGTNIQAGLLKANELLSNSTADDKVVILLSDGAPNKPGHGDEPSEKAIAAGKTLKDNGIKVYTIGYDIAKNQTAKNILQSISSGTGYAFLADNETELLNKFNDIIKNISIIATNVIVTDVIPEYFNLNVDKLEADYSNVQVNYDDFTKEHTITWTIGDFSIYQNYELIYDITTKDDYYGNINTNKNAILTGTPTDSNPYYIRQISETFPLPYIPVPMVTNNDNYDSKYNNTLTIDSDNGLLKNDSQTLLTDNSASVTNKIIVTDTNNSCGTLTVLDDGSFEYNTETNCIGKSVTFDYIVETTIVVNKDTNTVTSNPSTITINVTKDEMQIVDESLSKTTTDIITSATSLVTYDLSYNEEISNYIGDITITIVDSLPYKIDITKSDLQGGMYDESKKTITWVFNYDDINTYLDGNKKIDINKEISVVYIDLDVVSETIENVITSKMETSEKTNEKTAKVTNNVDIKGKIIVHFVDNSNKELAVSIEIIDFVGSDYLTEAEEIKNYVLRQIMGEESGKITEGIKEVTYVYDEYKEKPPKTGFEGFNTKYLIFPFLGLGLFAIYNIVRKKTNISN